MTKFTINENKLKQIIRESVIEVLNTELNEGIVNFLRGRSEDTVVKINSCCGGSYRYSPKTGTYWYYGSNMDVEPCNTYIGYDRKILNVDDKVTKQEKQNVINLLTKWDRTNAEKIEQYPNKVRERNQRYYDEEQTAKQNRWNSEQQYRKGQAAEKHLNHMTALRNQTSGQHVDDGRHRNY